MTLGGYSELCNHYYNQSVFLILMHNISAYPLSPLSTMGQTSSVSASVQGQRGTPWQTVTCQREEAGYPEEEKEINY